MLTAAVALISRGTDAVSVRPASPGQTDSAGISFAKSFDEGTALADEIQSADSKELKDAVSTEGVVPGRNPSVIAALVGIKAKEGGGTGDAENKIEKESINEKTLKPSANAKTTPPRVSDVMATAISRMPQHNGKSNRVTSTVIQTEVPDGEISSGDAKNHAQRSALGTDVDAADGAACLQTDVAASITSSTPVEGVKPATRNQDGMLASVMNQETAPIKKVAKDQDGDPKPERAARTEKKAENNFSAPAGSAVVAAAQTVATAPVMALPVDGQQPKLGVAADDVSLSMNIPATTGRSVEIRATATNRTDKRPVGAGKADDDNVKTSSSAVTDDAASRKLETDASKTGLSAAKATDGDNAKTQTPVTATTAGRIHTGPEAPEIVVAGASGNVAIHVITTGSHAMETNSHAVATPQVNVVDPVVPMDSAHKTLTAIPASLEVGVADGTHGWLKVRAEMTDGGVVNASLSSASSSGQEMLHRELPSLTAYLQSERVAVNTVVVQPTVATGSDPRGPSGGMNGDGRGQAQQGGGQGGESRQDAASAVLHQMESNGLYNHFSGVGGDELLPLLSYAGGGGWLNVRA